MISSSQNPKIKLVRALSGRAKERREAGAFLAEGVRLVEEANTASWPFRFALYSDDLSERGRELLTKLRAKEIDVEQVDARLLRSLSETETTQGILAVLEPHELSIVAPLDFILIPDSVRDPGNLGTLLRSADAAGVQAVLLPPETVDPFSPKVVRAGMGAHFRLPIRVVSWDDIRALTRDLRVYLKSHLCDLHREMYAEASADPVDWVDAHTAEVKPIDGILYELRTHCSLQPDYIHDLTSVVDAVFRVFMVNDNQPMSPRELGERIGKDPELILKAISGKTVYKGLRPVMEGAG